MTALFCRSVCPRLRHQRLHLRQRHVASNHLPAQDEGRGAGDLHLFAQRAVGRNHRFNLGRGHAVHDRGRVQAECTGQRRQAVGRDIAVHRHQRIMDIAIGLAIVQLLHRDGKAGGHVRFRAQNGVFLDDEADVAIRLQQLVHLGKGAAAIAAAIIHELDQGDVAIGIAADPGMAVVEQRIGKLHDIGGVRIGLGLGLAGIQQVDHLDQHFGVVQQIGADLLAKGVALGLGHRGQVECGDRARQQGGGSKGKAKAHRHILTC